MNLPHQEPLIFAKKIIKIKNGTAYVLCEFKEIPTLAMLIEAAAQASSSFDNLHNKDKIGFLTVAKDIELLTTPNDTIYIIKLNELMELNNIKQFSFGAFTKVDDIKVVTGSFTILIQE